MLHAHLHADASRHLITCRPLAAGCRILCAMLCESCTNICTSNTHVLNGNIITLSRTYSSTIQNAEFDFRLQTSECRMRPFYASIKKGPSVCILHVHLRPFYAFLPKVLEDSRSLEDAHQTKAMHSQLTPTSNSDFDFNSAVSTLHCRIRVHGGFTSEFDCDFRIQNREESRI